MKPTSDPHPTFPKPAKASSTTASMSVAVLRLFPGPRVPDGPDLCRDLPLSRGFHPLSPSDVEPSHGPVSSERKEWSLFDEGRIWDSERSTPQMEPQSPLVPPLCLPDITTPTGRCHNSVSPISLEAPRGPGARLPPRLRHVALHQFAMISHRCQAPETGQWAQFFALYRDLRSSPATLAISWPSRLVSAEQAWDRP